VGLQIARRGEHLYGFAGLRAFKAKFGPVWMPRYLAAPPLSAAPALLDVIRLIRRPAPPARVTTFDPVTRRS
jgi:phosphatidylglycerol lysyltransferase